MPKKKYGRSPAYTKEFRKLSERFRKGHIGMSHYSRQCAKLRKKYAKKK